MAGAPRARTAWPRHTTGESNNRHCHAERGSRSRPPRSGRRHASGAHGPGHRPCAVSPHGAPRSPRRPDWDRRPPRPERRPDHHGRCARPPPSRWSRRERCRSRRRRPTPADARTPGLQPGPRRVAAYTRPAAGRRCSPDSMAPAWSSPPRYARRTAPADRAGARAALRRHRRGAVRSPTSAHSGGVRARSHRHPPRSRAAPGRPRRCRCGPPSSTRSLRRAEPRWGRPPRPATGRSSPHCHSRPRSRAVWPPGHWPRLRRRRRRAAETRWRCRPSTRPSATRSRRRPAQR